MYSHIKQYTSLDAPDTAKVRYEDVFCVTRKLKLFGFLLIDQSIGDLQKSNLP